MVIRRSPKFLSERLICNCNSSSAVVLVGDDAYILREVGALTLISLYKLTVRAARFISDGLTTSKVLFIVMESPFLDLMRLL